MRTFLRRLGVGFGALVLLLCVAAAGVYAVSQHHLTRRYDIAARPLPVAAVDVSRGRHVATAIAKCGDCHGDDLGGGVMVDDPAFGRLVAPNLTRGAGGAAARLSDADFVRAIHHGVRRDGTPLVVMPANAFTHLSGEDLAAVIAYLRSVPPVERALPATRVGPLARALFVAGKLDDLAPAELIDHAAGWAPAVDPSDTLAFGRYLVVNGGCNACHGPNLAGGAIPGAPPGTPPAPNLTRAGAAGGSEADFTRILRTGVRPGGSRVGEAMPIKFTKLMTDEEIHAVWQYLRSLPAVETFASR